MEIRTRAENVLSSNSITATPAKIEFLTRMIRMFEAICELPVGRYWLMHGSQPCMRYWRKSLYWALGVYAKNRENPIKDATETPVFNFSDIYDCFLHEFKLAVDNPARTLMLEGRDGFEHYATLAAAECGLLLPADGCEPQTGASPSAVQSLKADWNMRRDFEWCVPEADLHDYGGKIQIERRKMRIAGLGCYNLLGGHDCDFATWSSMAPSLFLRYKIEGDKCEVFGKDTARILEVSHDASYVRGSRRSETVVENGELEADELTDANDLLDRVLHSCQDMAGGDDMLGDTYFMTHHLLRYKSDAPSLLLLMMGDTDTRHAVSTEAACGFELDPKMWMSADMPRVVGILHAALPEGLYPARVFTRAGASTQARAWIKSKFLASAAFQSFCRRWELKPRVALATPMKVCNGASTAAKRKGAAVAAASKRACVA